MDRAPAGQPSPAPLPGGPVAAGAVYFVVVFAAGFALGVGRTLALAPRLGETGAVLAELPLILAIAWVAARSCARRFAVPAAPGARLAMGGIALALLLLAETALSILILGRAPDEHLARYATPAAALGLLGQIAFALFPVLLLRRR